MICILNFIMKLGFEEKFMFVSFKALFNNGIINEIKNKGNKYKNLLFVRSTVTKEANKTHRANHEVKIQYEIFFFINLLSERGGS